MRRERPSTSAGVSQWRLLCCKAGPCSNNLGTITFGANDSMLLSLTDCGSSLKIRHAFYDLLKSSHGTLLLVQMWTNLLFSPRAIHKSAHSWKRSTEDAINCGVKERHYTRHVCRSKWKPEGGGGVKAECILRCEIENDPKVKHKKQGLITSAGSRGAFERKLTNQQGCLIELNSQGKQLCV